MVFYAQWNAVFSMYLNHIILFNTTAINFDSNIKSYSDSLHHYIAFNNYLLTILIPPLSYSKWNNNIQDAMNPLSGSKTVDLTGPSFIKSHCLLAFIDPIVIIS